MKLIIYRDLAGYKVTTAENYYSRIQNARRITDCSAFDSPAEIIAYYCKYFNSQPGDFTVIKEA